MNSQINTNGCTDHTVETRSRRAALRAVLAGSGAVAAGAALPTKWTKPVVDSVLLPAHAVTSNLPTHFFGTVTTMLADNSSNPAERLFGLLVPTAYAQSPTFSSQACIDSPDGTTFTAVVASSEDVETYAEISGLVGGPATPFVFECGGPPPDAGVTITFAVSSITEAGASYVVGGGFVAGSGTLPPGSGCPPRPEICVVTLPD